MIDIPSTVSSTAKWAVITGASSGIGKALAFEFAKNGFNLFLTARNENALAEIAEACRRRFDVETEVFPADLADADSTDRLVREVSGRRFDVLVNNAGFGIKGDFVETDIHDELKMLNVHLAALLRLTKAVLPKMVEFRRGNILSVASVYSFAPAPMQSVYSASKAFVLHFSSALQNEVKDANVQVSVVCPGITQTEFRARAGIADKKGSGMTAEKVAEISFLQMMKGRHIIVPGFQNRFFVFVARHIPSVLFTSVVRWINNRRGVNRRTDA
jgi:short-subunit dehydrogenase